MSYLSTVNFEEACRDDEIEWLVLWGIEILKDAFGRHGVDTLLAILRAPLEIAAHRVGLSASGLAVREARGEAPLENRLHQRLGGIPATKAQTSQPK